MNKIDSKIIEKNHTNSDKLLISNDDIVKALKTVYDPEIPVDIKKRG